MAKQVNQMLEQKAKMLSKKVEVHKVKRGNLARQAKETKQYVENIKTSIQISRSLLDHGTEDEIISSQKMMLDNANHLLAKRKEHFKLPVPDVRLNYTAAGKEPINAYILRELENTLGEVNDGNKDKGKR